ncbi:MAG: RNA-guided endonuclease InsQ/TnpB family protein [Acidimicrobiales bacterium]
MAKRKSGSQDERKAGIGRRYRLAPSPETFARLTQWGHTRRFLKNRLLWERWLAYDLWKKPVGCSVVIDELRECFDWVEDFPRQAANEAATDVEAAFSNWVDSDNPAGRPVFEKRTARLRFSLPGQAVDVRHVDREHSEVYVPKIGWVRFRRHRPVNGVVRNATFFFSPSAGWEVSFGVAARQHNAPPNGKPGVGSDFGVACSAFLSDEPEPRLMAPTLTKGEQARLVGLERRKARQVTYAKKHNKGRYSKRLRRTISEIAKLRGRQARRRADFTHKLTTGMAKNHGFVGIEDLRVKNMTASAKGTAGQPGTNVVQKAGLDRAILDNAPGERRRQLGYKCTKYGSDLRPVPPFNTSNTCPNPDCGKVDPKNRAGCGREFSCVHCGYTAHADWAAAVTIKRRAQAQGPSGGLSPSQWEKKHQRAATTAGPAGNSTGRRKPSQSRKAEGASVKPTTLGVGSRVA